MNAKLLDGLVAASFLVAGVGTAHADNFRSASTPEKTPNLTTPAVGTPALATPVVATPGETVAIDVQPIQLPSAAGAELHGIVERDVSTPTATPPISATPAVPSLAVASVPVPSMSVGSIPVQVELPAAVTVGTDGAHAWSSGLLTTIDAAQSSGGLSLHAGGATVNAGLDG
jgi:hypothetical protein